MTFGAVETLCYLHVSLVLSKVIFKYTVLVTNLVKQELLQISFLFLLQVVLQARLCLELSEPRQSRTLANNKDFPDLIVPHLLITLRVLDPLCTVREAFTVNGGSFRLNQTIFEEPNR